MVRVHGREHPELHDLRRLYAARFPIEQMHITTTAEAALPATGDGNNTSAFVCPSFQR